MVIAPPFRWLVLLVGIGVCVSWPAFDARWECRKLRSAQIYPRAVFPEKEIKKMISRHASVRFSDVDVFCGALAP
jgi:hypothetical protein